MKLNWGHYILISFVLFVSLILYMVFRSYQHNNDLVAEDYYNREINFQDVIDKKSRTAALPDDIIWKSKERGILVSYPDFSEAIEGEILLFRPSDKTKDINFKIEINEKNQQFLIHDSFLHGKYLIQISWNIESEEYFTEGSAYVIE